MKSQNNIFNFINYFQFRLFIIKIEIIKINKIIININLIIIKNENYKKKNKIIKLLVLFEYKNYLILFCDL